MITGAGILALDFFTANLLNGTKVYVVAVIEHGTRRIRRGSAVAGSFIAVSWLAPGMVLISLICWPRRATSR